jgi:hypothetical protein
MPKRTKSRTEILPRNVAVEIPLPDGSVSLLVGVLVHRTPSALFLNQAAFVKDTSRRSEFFAGRFDSDVEIEPYPDDMEIELPATGATIYSWPHALLRSVK